MKKLPNVTVVIIDCYKHKEAIEAIEKTLEQIEPFATVFLTDGYSHKLDLKDLNVSLVDVFPPIKSKETYSEFVIKELYKSFDTDYVLIIQGDGYVLDGSAWSDDFLNYDYIGATWGYRDGRNVGNGGFSLRSRKLMEILATDPEIKIMHPEDEITGRLYRDYLVKTHGIKFAPPEIADKFSYECNAPQQPTFGFHGQFHSPFKPVVVIKRSGAMGDIVMMEPLLEFYHTNGFHVAVDIPVPFYDLFDRHIYPIYHVSAIGGRCDLIIDLDMAYENEPEQLVIAAYFEKALVFSEKYIRNPILRFDIRDNTKLFDKYVVIHPDDTAMAHRNVHGLDWPWIVENLQDQGYTVIQVGNGEKRYGIYMRCPTINMLMYVIRGAEFFIGNDSGPSQIAVGLNVFSFIFFGSVNPNFRYVDLTNIHILQNKCPIGKDGCYHKIISVRGQDCEVDKEKPPCGVHQTGTVINQINDVIKMKNL
jgi:hypothetical protein